ncbi:RNA dependent RNA polymerase-domain-containing protein [Cantharellus anzutake]|uniref:RNA dependent RNA polymerase-domain-containing protein n=1 Tax=Cantharellus anzutake TaxID=1750568 RepID=UPI0019076D01|nr:RNA dependent RNA polymerase-domain-containing protein [Cantharellus anzutake]KAF8342289.1 RNA dependent RNA polymerase-domain-containing protein [Cantharellus anzutake]
MSKDEEDSSLDSPGPFRYDVLPPRARRPRGRIKTSNPSSDGSHHKRSRLSSGNSPSVLPAEDLHSMNLNTIPIVATVPETPRKNQAREIRAKLVYSLYNESGKSQADGSPSKALGKPARSPEATRQRTERLRELFQQEADGMESAGSLSPVRRGSDVSESPHPAPTPAELQSPTPPENLASDDTVPGSSGSDSERAVIAPPSQPDSSAVQKGSPSCFLSDGHFIIGSKDIPSYCELQNQMTRHKLPWAVQYETWRYNMAQKEHPTFSQWCQIFHFLDKHARRSEGHISNITARNFSKVCAAFLNAPAMGDAELSENSKLINELEMHLVEPGDTSQDPFVELDREELDIKTCELARLGVSRSQGQALPWYGGKVVQKFRLSSEPTSRRDKKYAFQPEKLEIGRSHRVSRFYGSRRVISVSIRDSIVRQATNRLTEFFSHSFVFSGKVFQAVYAKEATVYLVETGDFMPSHTSTAGMLPSHLSSNGRLSLSEFLEWHNPLRLNQKQSMTKYAARFALAFSTSVPVCHIDPKNVKRLPDIERHSGEEKTPSHLIFTDGCGFMNRALANIIRQRCNLVTIPVVVQGRFGGTKGLYLLHPDPSFNSTDEPMLWFRDSQKKIHNRPETPCDVSQFALDLLQPARLGLPARLSKEVLSCLSYGGVKTAALNSLYCNGLHTEYKKLADWEGDLAMLKLWDAVCETEHIIRMRARREALGAARAFGLGVEKGSDAEVPDVDEDENTAGQMTLGEMVLAFLAAGFNPKTQPNLAMKLRVIMSGVIGQYIDRYKVGVPLSAEGLAVPDPLGILEPGEVFCRSSTPWLDSDGHWRDTVLGPVLATRHPCKVASDVQKFEAVNCMQLRDYLDVIIFSTKGDRSPMSLLGGGDYDGDTVLLIWQPEIVSDFENAKTCRADPPADFEKRNFETEPKKVTTFLEETDGEKHPESQARKAQKYLLSALSDPSVVGRYSIMHEKTAFRLGYDHHETVRLAQMFCTCLDGAKSGLRVRKQVFEADLRKYERYHIPHLQKKVAEKKGSFAITDSQLQRVEVQRSPQLGEDIIKKLYDTGQKIQGELLKAWDSRQEKADKRHWLDKDLTRPYEDAKDRARRWSEQYGQDAMQFALRQIEDAVKDARALYLRFHQRRLSTAERQAKVRDVSSQYVSSLTKINSVAFSESEVKRVAASYCYVYDLEEHPRRNHGTDFPFDIAFRDIAAIKASSTLTHSTITREFADLFVLHRSTMKLLMAL